MLKFTVLRATNVFLNVGTWNFGMVYVATGSVWTGQEVVFWSLVTITTVGTEFAMIKVIEVTIDLIRERFH